MLRRLLLRRFHVQNVLCSEGLIFRSSYMFRMSFIKKKRKTAQTAPQEETQGTMNKKQTAAAHEKVMALGVGDYVNKDAAQDVP